MAGNILITSEGAVRQGAKTASNVAATVRISQLQGRVLSGYTGESTMLGHHPHSCQTLKAESEEGEQYSCPMPSRPDIWRLWIETLIILHSQNHHPWPSLRLLAEKHVVSVTRNQSLPRSTHEDSPLRHLPSPLGTSSVHKTVVGVYIKQRKVTRKRVYSL